MTGRDGVNMSEASSNIRAYSGRDDLVLLQDFASRALAVRFPLEATWHPGDFSWQLMPDYDRSHRVRMWLNGDAVKAVAMFEAPGRLFLEILPQSAALLPQIVARAERSAQHAGQPALYVRVYDGDQDRVAALSRLGYARSAPEGVVFRCDLSQPLPTRDLAPGFRIRDCTGIDPVRRAKAHRDAWDDLSEIGLPEARSSFTTEVYDGLRRAATIPRSIFWSKTSMANSSPTALPGSMTQVASVRSNQSAPMRDSAGAAWHVSRSRKDCAGFRNAACAGAG